MLRLVMAVIVIGTGLIGYRACGQMLSARRDAKYPATLVKVVDGDTIRVRDTRGEELKVRLVGIDAPELGTAASFKTALYAAEILEAARKIEIEPEPSKPEDKYRRVLAWVWITDEHGRVLLLQEELVKAGLCELYRDAKGSKYYGRLERVR